ncbi:hypothetical protein CMV_026517 [Castanea mollissima]|uniref:Uncharacterized protein n=1 Tax=Castanea mollissima TaxID=60419 RepID=A0A8J4VFT7_9ROSI|nr:hypothetical protein CMV_026517 [Castanea mollissima]
MWNAFVLLRIPLSSKTTLKMLMTLKTLCSHLYYLLAPLLMVHIRILDVSTDSDAGDPDGNGFELGSSSTAHPFLKRNIPRFNK